MISRVICARRICLSCRFDITKRVTVRPRTFAAQHDLGRRRFASAQDVSKDDILEALMSGRRSVGKKAGKLEKLPSWDLDTEESVKKANEDDKPPTRKLDAKVPTRKAKTDRPRSSREIREAQYATQDAPQQIPEGPEDEPLQIEEIEDQDHLAERAIARTFSDEDFDHWAADEDKPPSEALNNYQESGKPYIVGKTRLDRQSVGVGALGQRFNALVMKDPDTLGHNEGRVLTATDDLPHSIPFDLEGFSPPEDAGLEADEEAFLNLDALRPTDSSTLTRHDFEALRDEIADGFNGTQLVSYWRRHNDPALKPAEASAAYPWLRDLGTWVPVDEESIRPISREKKAKQYYAYRLMTQNWGLQIQEEVEMPGRVTARLATVPHTLITRPSIGILEKIQDDLLDEAVGERITPVKSNRSLTIVARKPVVPVLLARIDAMLESLEKQRISVDGIPGDLLKREALDELEKVTQTIILMDQQTSYIDVCWPRAATMSGANQVAPERGTPADTVRRLLLGRQIPDCTTEEQITAKRFRGEGVAGRVGTLVPYHRENRSMSWKDRLAPWARFIIPTIIPGELKKVRWMKLAEKVSFPHMDEVSEASMDQLTATFGHILHAPLPKAKVKGRSKTTYRRAVSPVMPHPAAFTELAPQRGAEIKQGDSIVVHFIPTPGGTSADVTAPPLKLIMPFTGDEDFSNFTLPSNSTLNAPKPSFVKDLLFPEEAVDARVERHRDPALDIDQQSAFKEFIATSEFNLAQGRLQTPSKTRFTIPKAWLAQSGKKQTQANDEVVNLPYLFGGLEVRQTIDMPLENDIILRYESVEAGQHGGTRQELSLVLDLAGRSGLGIQTSVTDFLGKLGNAVEGKYWPWSRGVAKVHELPSQNDPIWDQFKPEPPAKTDKQPRGKPNIIDYDNIISEEDDLVAEEMAQDEPGAPVEGFPGEDETSPVVPRSEPIDWNSAPLAPVSQHQREMEGLESQEARGEGLQPLSELFSLKQSQPPSSSSAAEPRASDIQGATGLDDTEDVSSHSSPEAPEESTTNATFESSLTNKNQSEASASAESGSHSAAEASSSPGPDSSPAGPSTTQTPVGPFSPTSSKQKRLPKTLPHEAVPSTDTTDKSRQSKPRRRQPPASIEKDEDDGEWPELDISMEEYESMDADALAAKIEAAAGGVSLEELYRRAGATPEQIAALEEESQRFEEQWKTLAEQSRRGDHGDERPLSKKEIEAEKKRLKQSFDEDNAIAEAELQKDLAELKAAEEKRQKQHRKM